MTDKQVARTYLICHENLIEDRAVVYWFFRAVRYLGSNSGTGIDAVLRLMEKDSLFVETVETTILQYLAEGKEPYREHLV